MENHDTLKPSVCCIPRYTLKPPHAYPHDNENLFLNISQCFPNILATSFFSSTRLNMSSTSSTRHFHLTAQEDSETIIVMF